MKAADSTAIPGTNHSHLLLPVASNRAIEQRPDNSFKPKPLRGSVEFRCKATRNHTMVTLAEFQEDMRRGYIWGATGIMTSGMVWLAAGLVAYFNDPRKAIWVLFIGAGFIVPVSNLIDRLLGAAGKHAPGNRLSALALETTVFMLMCLPLAYGLALYRIEWFFPAVLMVIGGRYITFATVYGTKVYWLLGAALGAGAMLAYVLAAPPHLSALLGAAIEIVFGAALLLAKRRVA